MCKYIFNLNTVVVKINFESVSFTSLVISICKQGIEQQLKSIIIEIKYLDISG